MSATSTLIFSRDRPAQLDLLLSSLKQHAPDLFSQVTVLWTATDRDYARGYDTLQDEHPEALCLRELNFQQQVREIVDGSARYAAFLVDDCIAYRWLYEPVLPDKFLGANDDVLAFSLRLGKQGSDVCYPLRQSQTVPPLAYRAGQYVWEPAAGKHDWAYGCSLDGDIFRSRHLRLLLRGGYWGNPNQLEEHLCRQVAMVALTKRACYSKSLIVGCPVNSVSATHGSNRYGDQFPVSTQSLNEAYLAGRRITVESLDFSGGAGAHCEVDLTAGLG